MNVGAFESQPFQTIASGDKAKMSAGVVAEIDN